MQPTSRISLPPTSTVEILYFDTAGDVSPIETLALGRGMRVNTTRRLVDAMMAFRTGLVEALICRLHSDHDEVERMLRASQELVPSALRIVLCDEGEDPKTLLRYLPFAHQFISISDPTLGTRVRRSLQLQALMSNKATRELVGAGNQIPVPPQIYSQLVLALRDPGVTVLKLAEIIEQNLSLSAQLVQLVSSAFFGLPRQISSLGGCIAYLGPNTVKTLVLAAEVEQAFRPQALPGFSYERLQKRSFVAARIAKRVAEHSGFEEDAFIAALFHSVGQLVLAKRAPARFARALNLATERGMPLAEAELEVLRTTHSRVGAYLLGVWGLPIEVVEAVLHHEEPQLLGERALNIASAVYIGQRLAENASVRVCRREDQPTGDWLDQSFLEDIGIADHVDELREFAKSA